MRFLLLFLALISASVAEARYCNQVQCKMCNRIFGPLPGYELNADYTVHRASTQQQPIYQQYIQPQPTYSQPTYSVTTTQQSLPSEALRALDPSSQEAVETMLRLLVPTSDDVLYDLGSGDGRTLIAASEKYGTPGLGIEINSESAELSRTKIQEADLDNVRIVTGDATKYDLSEATLVTMYLYPQVIQKLMPNIKALRSGTRVISYAHPIPVTNTRRIVVGENTFYLWIAP